MLDTIELTLCFSLTDSGFHVFANFPGDSTRNEPGYEKYDGIEADISLRNGSGSAGNGRSPAKIDGSNQVGDSGGDAGEPANPGIEAKNRENNKNEKKESGGTGDGPISRFECGGGEESESDGRQGGFKNGRRDPKEFGKLLVETNGTIDEAKHEVFVDGNNASKDKIPSDVRGEDSSVKQEDASGENYADNGNENQDAENADTLAAKFGETESFGLKFLLGHGLDRAIIRGKKRNSKRKGVTEEIGNCGGER